MMKRHFFTNQTPLKVIFICLTCTFFLTSCEQNLSDDGPYIATADTVKWVLVYPGSRENIISFKLRDGSNVGTDAFPGAKQTLYFSNKNFVFEDKNFPFYSDTIINVQKGDENYEVKVRFNGISCFFPKEYRQKHNQGILIEIPEVYELANILWVLSQEGKYSQTLPKNTDYISEVEQYFTPYLKHPIFEKLQVPDSLYFTKYYEFRENSFTFQFDGDKLVRNGPFYFVYGEDRRNFTSFFTELKTLVEDFAKTSNYRQFYQSHKSYYDSLVREQAEMIPVRNIWDWMEREFPNNSYQAYRVVFSPLIGGSHSTQNFSTFDETIDDWFSESVMFVCGNRYASDKSLSREQMKGLMSGVFLTEVDHNYVNSASRKYREDIDSIFENRDLWANDQARGYQSPMSVFNEYMTHAVYSLWVLENFDEKTANFLIDHREKLNIKRGFIKFPEFNQALIKISKENPDKKTIELYPDILEWCKKSAL